MTRSLFTQEPQLIVLLSYSRWGDGKSTAGQTFLEKLGTGRTFTWIWSFNSSDGTTNLPTLPDYKGFERFPQKPLHAGGSVPLRQGGAQVWHTVRDRPFGERERESKDLLLCSTCESLLDQGGESYVLSRIASKMTREFPLHRMLSLALPRESYPDISRFSGDDLGIDMEKFAHFALGIVWRATIHDWTMPDGTLLPRQAIGDFEPPIRSYLLGGTFPPDTSVIVIVCSDHLSRRIWNTPTILIEANCLNFRFLARGVFFRVMMGYQLPEAFREMSCISPRKCLFYGNAAHRMPEIMAIFESTKME